MEHEPLDAFIDVEWEFKTMGAIHDLLFRWSFVKG